MEVSEPISASSSSQRRRRSTIQGNDLLYHYFQKTLLQEDPERFRDVITGLVVALGIWLPPIAYRRFPLLVPYAIRDPSCRGDRRRQVPDEWGAPDAQGRFRDDNSLIKGIPRSLVVENVENKLVNGKRLGTGFVAAHVWRRLSDGSDAPRDRRTYSFLPNLIWLPNQLAKLSDREDGFVQILLQALSTKLYRSLCLTPRLAAIVEPIWNRLPVGGESVMPALPDVARLNYFRFDERWLARRRRTLEVVHAALVRAGEGSPPAAKVVASRYGSGLAQLQPSAVAGLRDAISEYVAAVSEAAETPD
jgi:hypothetical protein